MKDTNKGAAVELGSRKKDALTRWNSSLPCFGLFVSQIPRSGHPVGLHVYTFKSGLDTLCESPIMLQTMEEGSCPPREREGSYLKRQ